MCLNSAVLDVGGLVHCKRQLAEMRHWRHSIVNFGITRMKSEILSNTVFSAVLFERRTDVRTRLSFERFNMQQTSRPVRTGEAVGEIISSQVETRNPHRSLATECSHGTRSSHESFSASRVAQASLTERPTILRLTQQYQTRTIRSHFGSRAILVQVNNCGSFRPRVSQVCF